MKRKGAKINLYILETSKVVIMMDHQVGHFG